MIILLLIYSLSGLGNLIFAKLCSNNLINGSRGKYTMYFIVNSVVACLFFLAYGGFRITIDPATLIYSFVYALIVLASLISSLLVYRYAAMSTVNIVTSFAGMILTAVIGRLFFDEVVDIKKLVRIAVTLVAVLLIFLDALFTQRQSGETKLPVKRSRRWLIALVLCLAMRVIAGQGNTVVNKLYAGAENVADENSFFFLTNLILTVGAAFLLGYDLIRRKVTAKELILMLTPKNLVFWSGSTVCSNIASLVVISLLALMDMSVFTPVTSALGIITSLAASLIFRERLGIFAYLAAAVACIAVII